MREVNILLTIINIWEFYNEENLQTFGFKIKSGNEKIDKFSFYWSIFNPCRKLQIDVYP